MTVMSSRQFNQDTGKAEKAAEAGPVFITDRGRTGHVLLSIDEYRRLTSGEKTVPDRKPERDGFIGAPAHAHNMALITRTVRDFEGMDIRILDPWLDV